MLGSAGHVEAADQRHGLKSRVPSEDFKQRLQGGAERRHLLGEAEDQASPGNVALGLDAGQQAVVQALHQGVEGLARALRLATHGGVGAEREGVAPDLLAAGSVQIVEELREAGQQVNLGEQQVDGGADAELLADLVDTGADGPGVGQHLALVGGEQVGRGKRDDDAGERLARAVAFQEVEQAVPGLGVSDLVAVLGGVATGGVDQDGAVGEPPVGGARAADAAERRGADLLRHREVQAAIV